MLRVNAKQGAPKDGNSVLELFQVDIYPLKIHLTESMYRVMWGYFFPGEEKVSQRRQEVWKVSTAGSKRVKKSISGADAIAFSSQSTKESEVPGKSNGDSSQVLKLSKGKMVSGSNHEHRRSSSSDRTWEENVAESVANELVQQMHSSKDSKPVKSGRSSQEEKKFAKSQDDKSARPQKMMEFHNIKISQVELLLTYQGSRFVVSDLRLLMDSFHRDEFTGTWRRLFSRVKKHIIWGVLKSVTGMQAR
ncbi:protein SABRE-like isoform X2 [Iris pallida]|uniref:Protein SABRE-like isoform X2 n=1 Tax=Iris pallida TaxID=29817 RepID=A0AAX6FMH9_IRIPA|nr:protein SABRE-like isoform X3 [Iris pallida]KAJ6817562.1 protein SABRE-like isoform X2 [Iris pallida]